MSKRLDDHLNAKHTNTVKKICGFCHFSLKTNHFEEYECHINPPIVGRGSYISHTDLKAAEFPIINSNDWCGQWKEKTWTSKEIKEIQRNR